MKKVHKTYYNDLQHRFCFLECDGNNARRDVPTSPACLVPHSTPHSQYVSVTRRLPADGGAVPVRCTFRVCAFASPVCVSTAVIVCGQKYGQSTASVAFPTFRWCVAPLPCRL